MARVWSVLSCILCVLFCAHRAPCVGLRVWGSVLRVYLCCVCGARACSLYVYVHTSSLYPACAFPLPLSRHSWTATKSPSVSALLKASLLRKNVIFTSLEPGVVDAVVDAMREEPVDADVTIITQGADASSFFVVEAGYLDVFIDGNKVCVCV